MCSKLRENVRGSSGSAGGALHDDPPIHYTQHQKHKKKISPQWARSVGVVDDGGAGGAVDEERGARQGRDGDPSARVPPLLLAADSTHAGPWDSLRDGSPVTW